MIDNTNTEPVKANRPVFKRRCPACKNSYETQSRIQICCSGRCRKARHDAKIRKLLSQAKRIIAQQARIEKGQ